MVYAAQAKELERLCNANGSAVARELHERLQAVHAPLLAALDATALKAVA